MKCIGGLRLLLLVAILASVSLACDLNAVLNAALSSSTPTTSSSCPPFKSAQITPPGFPVKLTWQNPHVAQKKIQSVRRLPLHQLQFFTRSSRLKTPRQIPNSMQPGMPLDTGGASECNTEIDSTDLTSSDSRNLDFTLTPNSKWPPGTFRVEIAVNGKLALVQNFSVK